MNHEHCLWIVKDATFGEQAPSLASEALNDNKKNREQYSVNSDVSMAQGAYSKFFNNFGDEYRGLSPLTMKNTTWWLGMNTKLLWSSFVTSWWHGKDVAKEESFNFKHQVKNSQDIHGLSYKQTYPRLLLILDLDYWGLSEPSNSTDASFRYVV